MKKILVLSMFFCTAFATSAFACIFSPTPTSGIRDYELVFLGEVISSECVNKKNITKFAVKKMWKGEKNRVLTFEPTGCKKVWYHSGDIGSLHIIYANYTEDKAYFTRDFNMCSLLLGTRIEYGTEVWLEKLYNSLIHGLPFDYGAKKEMAELGKPLYEF
jgi:hypothetical protein